MEPNAPPAGLTALDPDRIVDVDVREDLRHGREPFRRIMQAQGELRPDQVLRLRAIFEPVPLYRVMEGQGLLHWSEQLGEDDWQVWFYRSDGVQDPGGPLEIDATGTGPAVAVPGNPSLEETQIIDVRGLEPPEPMVQTLQALELLPQGHKLVQVNSRIPRFLLPELESRGFGYQIREDDPEAVRVFIWRR